MKAFYKTVLYGETARPESILKTTPEMIYDIKLISMSEPCCDRMRDALDERVIKFGEFDSMLNMDTNINFAHCRPFPEGALWDEYAISFCPFCGTPIQTEEKERVRLVEIKHRVHETRTETKEVPL